MAQIAPLKIKKDFNVLIENEKFKISSSGILGQKLEIKSINDEIVLKLEPEKWYSNIFLLRFNNTAYKLVVRNNPFSEFAILSDNEELLAYGLDILKENNKLVIRIIEKDNNQPTMFHVLLWYFFAPVAQENSGDSFWWIYGI